MAQQRLRPGPWRLVYSSTSAPITIQIDYEKFDIPPAVSGTRNSVDFDVKIMGSYDDANIIAYRNPILPTTITGNVGQSTTVNVTNPSGTTGWWGGGYIGPPRPRKTRT